MITIEWLYVIAGLLAGALVTWVVTALFHHKGYSKKSRELLEMRQKTKDEALTTIGEAVKEGEDKKREILLSVKEEVHKAKLELERDVRERRQDLTRERQRIDQKETVLDRRAQSLEDREEQFKDREAELQTKEYELAAIDAQKRVELERLAGLSVSDARDIVIEAAEREYRYDLALLYKKLEDEVKSTASAKAREIAGAFENVVVLGIGGSALGPDLLVDALGRHSGRYDVAVVSNVDGAALAEAVRAAGRLPGAGRSTMVSSWFKGFMRYSIDEFMLLAIAIPGRVGPGRWPAQQFFDKSGGAC